MTKYTDAIDTGHKAIKTTLSLGSKCLNPDDFVELERILVEICKRRAGE